MAKLKLAKEKILWKDRKRWLGMPLSFTKYMVTEERLITKIGFFSSTTDELLLYRIMDVKMRRTLWEKLCRVGTVTLYSADYTDRELRLRHIKQPDQVRRFISRKVEEIRTARGLVGREIIGAAGQVVAGHDHGHDHHVHNHPCDGCDNPLAAVDGEFLNP